MAAVYLMCGKICSGKSTHARQIRDAEHAVVLSVDEITLALFGQDAGDMLDEYVKRTETYLYGKSVEIVRSGTSVVLDWGFWTKEERCFAKSFYASQGIRCEFHYIRIGQETWHRRIEKRNQDVLDHLTDAYYVDEGLVRKFESIFEEPDEQEVDQLIQVP